MRGLSILCAAVAVSLALIPLAWAGFDSSASAGGANVTSASLAAASGLSGTCAHAVALLSWTATASTFADGYEILRGTTSGGPYTHVANVTGQATVTYSDSSLKKGTYYYVVRATKQLWRSTDSNQAAVSC
jgi:hypothetical protein